MKLERRLLLLKLPVEPCRAMAENRNKWLGEGWLRDNFDGGALYRTVGEAHRGPEGADSWSDRHLALVLRDFATTDARAAALRKARTRLEYLMLLADWEVPYVSSVKWQRTLDTDEGMFQVGPMPRAPTAPVPHANVRILVVADIADIPCLSHGAGFPSRWASSSELDINAVGGGGGGLWNS